MPARHEHQQRHGANTVCGLLEPADDQHVTGPAFPSRAGVVPVEARAAARKLPDRGAGQDEETCASNGAVPLAVIVYEAPTDGGVVSPVVVALPYRIGAPDGPFVFSALLKALP